METDFLNVQGLGTLAPLERYTPQPPLLLCRAMVSGTRRLYLVAQTGAAAAPTWLYAPLTLDQLVRLRERTLTPRDAFAQTPSPGVFKRSGAGSGAFVEASALSDGDLPPASLTLPEASTLRSTADLLGFARETYSLRLVADLCGVSPTRVRTWIRRRDLHAWRTPGGHPRTNPDALLDFFKRHAMPDQLALLRSAHPAPTP